MNGKDILARFESLFSLRKGSIEGTWNEIEQYISPMRSGGFYNPLTSENEVRSRRPEIWDLTAIKGLSILTASMQSSLISPAIRWFNFVFKDPKLDIDKDARAWLDECTDILYDSLQDSAFNLEMASCFMDLGAYGNSCLTLETESELEWMGADWTSVPLRDVYFEMDYRGKPKTFYKFLQWTPVQIVSRGENDKEWRDSIPEYIKTRAGSAEASGQKIDLIYCVYRRLKPDGKPIKEPGDQTTLPPELRPWGCKYVLRGTSGESEKKGWEGGELGKEGGYYRMPAMIARWEKLAGSQWGLGPGNVALPTVKYLNAWMETEKLAAEKAVDPPILATERGLISPPDLTPGGMNVVRTMDDMKAFENKANFQAAYGSITELRQMVNEVFKVEDLKLKESPAMTAMEVQVRYEMMTRVLGPPAVRIQNDLLSPAIKNLFHMMARYNQFKPPPRQVLENPLGYDIEYQGPLMKAQRAQEVAQMERWAGIAMNLVKVFPEVTYVFDAVKFMKEAADRLSVPVTVLADDRTIEAKEKQAEADKNLQRAQVASEVQKNHADAACTAMEAQGLATGAQQLES